MYFVTIQNVGRKHTPGSQTRAFGQLQKLHTLYKLCFQHLSEKISNGDGKRMNWSEDHFILNFIVWNFHSRELVCIVGNIYVDTQKVHL